MTLTTYKSARERTLLKMSRVRFGERILTGALNHGTKSYAPMQDLILQALHELGKPSTVDEVAAHVGLRRNQLASRFSLGVRRKHLVVHRTKGTHLRRYSPREGFKPVPIKVKFTAIVGGLSDIVSPFEAEQPRRLKGSRY